MGSRPRVCVDLWEGQSNTCAPEDKDSCIWSEVPSPEDTATSLYSPKISAQGTTPETDECSSTKMDPPNQKLDQRGGGNSIGQKAIQKRANGTAKKLKFSTRDMEVINLVLRFLRDTGLESTAECLVGESNLKTNNLAAAMFKDHILNGQWAEAEKLIPSLGIEEKRLNSVLFLLNEQKYLELLFTNDIISAISILRNQLASLHTDTVRFEYLSSLLMANNVPGGFIRKPDTSSSLGSMRTSLLGSLQDLIPSLAAVPQDRLRVLIDQAIGYQISSCLYHDVPKDHEYRLYTDHSCNRDSFPASTCYVLDYHMDEVWYVSFSHDGRYLASASKDMTAIIWCMNSMKLLHSLVGHIDPVLFLSWSNSDKRLLTVSCDNTIKLWDAESGLCISTFRKHKSTVTSCAWLPSDEQFVSGGADKNICLCSINGDLIHTWKGISATDISVSPDGKILIVASERSIRLYDLDEKNMIGLFTESDYITSVNMSSVPGYALINLLVDGIHLWNLKEESIVRGYVGPKNTRFIIRSCFGGQNERYILSGGEDNQIYVWHKERGVLVRVLSGHTDIVNSVSWCSSRCAFASASDDRTIRIWNCGTGTDGYDNYYVDREA